MVTLKDNKGYIAINPPTTIAKAFCKDTSGTDEKELKLKLDSSTVEVPVPAASAKAFCKQREKDRKEAKAKEKAAKDGKTGAAEDTTKSKSSPASSATPEAEEAEASPTKTKKYNTPADTPPPTPAADPSPPEDTSDTPTKTKKVVSHGSPNPTGKTYTPKDDDAAEANESPSPAAGKKHGVPKATKTAAAKEQENMEGPADDAPPTADAGTDEASTLEVPPLETKKTQKQNHKVFPSPSPAEKENDKVAVQEIGHQKATKTSTSTPTPSPEVNAEVSVPEKPHQKPGDKSQKVEKRNVPTQTTMMPAASTSIVGAALHAGPLENAAPPRIRSWFGSWKRKSAVRARRPHEELVDETFEEYQEDEDEDSSTADDADNNLLEETSVHSGKSTFGDVGVGAERLEIAGTKGVKDEELGTGLKNDSEENSDSESDDEAPAPSKTPDVLQPETPKPTLPKPNAPPTPSTPSVINDKSPDVPNAPEAPKVDKPSTEYPQGVPVPVVPLPPSPARVTTPVEESTTEGTLLAEETPSKEKEVEESSTPSHGSATSSHKLSTPSRPAGPTPTPAPALPSTIKFILFHTPSTPSKTKHPRPTPSPPSEVYVPNCTISTYTSAPTTNPSKTEVPRLVTTTIGCMKPVGQTSSAPSIETGTGKESENEPDKSSTAWEVQDQRLLWTVCLLWVVAVRLTPSLPTYHLFLFHCVRC